MYFLGIDPGFGSGCICIMHKDGNPERIRFIDITSDNWQAVAGYFRNNISNVNITYAALEEVHASPRGGVSTMFKFGQGYGALWFWLQHADILHEVVKPQKWQSIFHLRGKKIINAMSRENRGMSRAKQFTVEYAQAKFPNLFPSNPRKADHNRADALCIALYAKHVWESKVNRDE